MYSYCAKITKNSEAVSDKYISVNNFGYNEDMINMDVRRAHGRVDFQLIYVKSGEITLHEKGKDVLLTDGSVCLFRPKEAQLYSIYIVPTTFFWIHFSGSEAEQMLSFFDKRSYHVGFFPEFERYCHGFSHEFQADRKYNDLLCEGELIALIARIAERIGHGEKKNADFSKIRPALAIMQSESCTRRSNEELAEFCGLSKFYFMKLFKNIIGISPQQYYMSLVIDKSCYLLMNTLYNVSEISVICGIEDSLYFSRVFKKHMGLSPSKYRKTNLH